MEYIARITDVLYKLDVEVLQDWLDLPSVNPTPFMDNTIKILLRAKFDFLKHAAAFHVIESKESKK